MQRKEKQDFELATFSGNSPQPRFGHTVTMISQYIAILFGGAIGNTGKFSITNDTYLCDLRTLDWNKLDRKSALNFIN